MKLATNSWLGARNLPGGAELLHEPVAITAIRSDMVSAFALVVGDEDEGDADLALDALSARPAWPGAASGQGGERLVEQQGPRLFTSARPVRPAAAGRGQLLGAAFLPAGEVDVSSISPTRRVTSSWRRPFAAGRRPVSATLIWNSA